MSKKSKPKRQLVVIPPPNPGEPITIQIKIDDTEPVEEKKKWAVSDHIALWAGVVNFLLLGFTILTLKIQSSQFRELNKAHLQLSLNLTLDSSDFVRGTDTSQPYTPYSKFGWVILEFKIANLKPSPAEMISRQESYNLHFYGGSDTLTLGVLKRANESNNLYSVAPMDAPPNSEALAKLKVIIQDVASMNAFDGFKKRTAFLTFAEVIVYKDLVTNTRRKLECVVNVTYRPGLSPDAIYLINNTTELSNGL